MSSFQNQLSAEQALSNQVTIKTSVGLDIMIGGTYRDAIR